MKKTIKRQWALLSLVTLGMLASAPSSHADGFLVGKVEYIRVHDGAYSSVWASPHFWFSLVGVSSAGSCYSWMGRVLFVANSKEALALVMTTYLTGKTIAVAYSDTNLVNGLCRADYVTVGDSPPAF